MRHIREHNASASSGTLTGIFHIGTANMCILLAVAGFVVAYLGVNARVAEYGFQIRDEERRIITLVEEERRLHLEVVRLQAMHAIEVHVADLGMIPVTNITYMDIGGAVAVK